MGTPELWSCHAGSGLLLQPACGLGRERTQSFEKCALNGSSTVPLADEERRGDLTVGLPLHDERHDATLGRRQGVRQRRPAADSPQLRTSLFRPERAPTPSKKRRALRSVSRAARRSFARLWVAPRRASSAQAGTDLGWACSASALFEQVVGPPESLLAAQSNARRRWRSPTPGPIECVAPALQPSSLSLGLL